MKKLFALLLLVIITGCGNEDFNTDNEITVPVSVEEIKLKSIEEFVDATGTVQSTKEVTLLTEITGAYNLQINPATGKKYVLGDRVKKGQVIIRLEDPEYENNIRIELQKLRLEEAKSEHDKQESLYKKGGVTLKELKTAELNYLDQKYTYENSIIQLEKMNVVAPFDGVITDLPYYTPNVKVMTNSPAVKVMDYSKLYLEINLPEKQHGVVKVNQQARVMSYTLEEDTLKGFVTQISPAIDSGTRTFKTSMLINNPDLLLRPGMFVKTELVVASKDSAIVIPKNIILSRQRGKTVYIVVKGASVSKTIRTGLENPTSVEVVSGLEVNQRLVTKGFETLRSRQKVKIVR